MRLILLVPCLYKLNKTEFRSPSKFSLPELWSNVNKIWQVLLQTLF
jgi:hypothetical protein